ncbi:MAG: hypothetical protein Q7S96_03550 [bacterium]|nr:hypothetical protein [bacterium]
MQGTTLRDRAIGLGTAAMLLVVVLVVSKVDAAQELVHVEEFTVVPAAVLDKWSAGFDAAGGRVVLRNAGAGGAWADSSALVGVAVYDAVYSPNYAGDRTALLAAADGIYRTTNSGSSWTRTLTTPHPVVALARSPAFGSDGTALAITNGSGFWKTQDGGVSFTQVDANLHGFGIAFSPAYATDRTMFVAGFDRVLRSSDGGTSWVSVSGSLPDYILVSGDVRGIALDPAYATNQTVFLSTIEKGLYRSTDGGSSWAIANPAGVSVPYVTGLASGGTNRVAAMFLSGIYETTNAGTSWTRIYSGDDANDLAYGPSGALFIARASGVAMVGADSGATAIAPGWSGGDALAVSIAPTYPADRSALGGRANGINTLVSGLVSPGIAVSAVGIDSTTSRIVSATITPTATTPAGSSITYALSVADNGAQWEGPIEPGAPWTFTGIGSTLQWRVTLASTDGQAAPSLTALSIAYTTENGLGAPQIATPTPKATFIRWAFTGAPGNPTGYRVHDAQGKVLAETTSGSATFIEETGLTSNTEYCGRRIVAVSGTQQSPQSAVYACVVTLAGMPGATQAAAITSSSVEITFSPGFGNTNTSTLFAVKDKQSGAFIGADGAIGAPEAVWKTFDAWNNGNVLVIGLTPDTVYAFCAVARNSVGVPSDCSNTAIVHTTVGDTRGDVSVTSGTSLIPPTVQAGGAIPFTVVVKQVGSGIARDVAVTIPMPTGIRHLPGTLTMNGTPLTDGVDGDAGSVSSTTRAVTFNVATLGVGARATFGITFTTMQDAADTVTFAPILTYVPSVGAMSRMAALNTTSVRVIVAAAPEVPPEVPRPPEPSEPSEPVTPPDEGAPEVPQPPVPEEGAPLTPTPEQPGAPPTPIPEVPTGDVERASAETRFELFAPTDGAVLPAGDLEVRGVAVAGASVTISLDGRSHWRVTAGADGVFSLTIRSVEPGTHRIATTADGAADAAQVRIAAPPERELVLTSPVTGSATNAQTIIVSGRGPANLVVTVALDDVVVTTVTSGEQGGFTALLPIAVTEGAHEVKVQAVTTSGLTLVSTAGFLVDRTPPSAPPVGEVRTVRQGASSARADAFDVQVEVGGSISVSEFVALDALLITVSSDPVTFTYRPTEPTWSYRTTVALEAGSHTVRVAARDRAGNISPLPQSLTFTVAPALCADGLDNDSDGLADFPADPDCTGPFDQNEATEGVATRAATAVAEATTATAKAVATVTQQTAKTTAKAAEQAATTVQKQVLDNPAVEVTTERIVAPAVVVAVAANTATAVHGFQLLAYGQYLIGFLLSPSRLFARRKRQAWGTVYGSLSKRPIDLATVRLVDAKTSRVIRTEVTDHLGRYHFAVQRAGTYRIEVKHSEFTFPSEQLAGRKEDGEYSDLTFGDAFAAAEGSFITKSVPMDVSAKRAVTSDASVVRKHYGRIVSGAISDAGLVLSIVAFAVSPRPHVGAILAANLIFYVLFRRLALRERVKKSWGAVKDAMTSAPLHLAIVRLFDQEFGKLLETAATDRYGRYRFLAGKSVYYVTAQKTGYESEKSHELDLRKREGVVGVDLKLKPIGKRANRAAKGAKEDADLP